MSVETPITLDTLVKLDDIVRIGRWLTHMN